MFDRKKIESIEFFDGESIMHDLSVENGGSYNANGFIVHNSAVMDDRVTDVCEDLNGTIFSLDDPNLAEPPLHFNCRSVLIPITQNDDYQVSEDTPNLDDYPEASGFYSVECNHKKKGDK
jgi:hypothetical protein